MRTPAPVFAALLALVLGGCTPTFWPLIPPERPIAGELPPRLGAGTLRRDGDALLLDIALQRGEPGFLEVVWFRGDRELGRDVVYLDAAQPQARFRLAAPARGHYRALLLYGGELLRQLELREDGP